MADNRNRPAPPRPQTRTQTQRPAAPARQQSARPAVRQSNANGSITLNKRHILLAALAILILANIIVYASLVRRSIPTSKTPDEVAEESRTILEETREESYDTVALPTADYTNGCMILVNEQHPFVFDYDGGVIHDDEIVQVNRFIENRTFKASDNNTKLGTSTVAALNRMFADFYAATGKNDCMILSAYRTYDEQKKILADRIARDGKDQDTAANPGASEHHTGYAMDISIYPDGGVGARTLTDEAPYDWLYENCQNYGIVRRYPEHKTAITGIAGESWHFRYVGVPNAVYMAQHDLVLEEYVEEVSRYSVDLPLEVEMEDGTRYAVYAVKKGKGDTTEFRVPKDTAYEISGDNVGNFIVWYKLPPEEGADAVTAPTPSVEETKAA